MRNILALVVASIVLYSSAAFGAVFTISLSSLPSPALAFQNALTAAQSNTEDDVINVAAGTYNISSTLTYKTDTGDSGHTLTIQGAGAGSTVLDGVVTFQIMYINTDTSYNGGDNGGDVTVSGITFQNGANSDYGAGCDIETTHASIALTNNTFSNNISVYNGGGASLSSYGSGSITLTNNTFNDNISTAGAGGGADVETYSGAIGLDSNIFRKNSAYGGDFGGGGANITSFSGSGIVTLTNNIFSGNSVSHNSGGGASIARLSSGGVITLTNNTFSDNSCTESDWYGGGVYIFQSFSGMVVNVYNNIFWNNPALTSQGKDLYIDDPPPISVNLYNNDFSGNADFVTGQSEGLYIDYIGSYSHGGNIQSDPLFVDSTNGDLHLTVGSSPSPCIDMGTNSAFLPPLTPLSADFEGDPRIMGGTVDIGADEARTTVTTLSSDHYPSTYNQSVTFTAHVTSPAGTPTGTVKFQDGGTDMGGCSAVTLSGGYAYCTTPPLTVGNHPITAVYGGNSGSNYPGSSASLTQEVDRAPTTTTVSSSQNPSTYNQSVTFTANVTSTAGTPPGTVEFQADGTNISGCSGVTLVLSGGVMQAQCTTSSLTVGSHPITAAYGGDTNFEGSSGSLTQEVDRAPTTTTVGSSQNPSTQNQSVTFTAHVTSTAGTPTGTVKFQDGGTDIGGCNAVTLSGGMAYCTTSSLTTGNHTITAVYDGDTHFLGSSSTLTQDFVTLAVAVPAVNGPGMMVFILFAGSASMFCLRRRKLH